MPPAAIKEPPLAPEELAKNIQKFEGYTQTFAVDIERLETRRQRLQEDLDEYDKLVGDVGKLIADGATSLEGQRVDVGCEVTCAARVPDVRRLYVAVGLGFHVEAALQEVAGLVGPRQAALREQLGEVERKLTDARECAQAFESSLRLLQENS